jgi:hypothetical protein
MVSDHQPNYLLPSAGPACGWIQGPPLFYHSAQGDPAYVSLSVLENRQNLGQTDRPMRAIRCSRRATVPRATLRSALGYLILPLWGGDITTLSRGHCPRFLAQSCFEHGFFRACARTLRQLSLQIESVYASVSNLRS